MRNVTCPHCQQTVPVPDDLASAHCVRCGQAFALETNIRADAPQALPSDAFSDRPITTTSLPDRWSSWDEFRANSPAVQRELMQLVARPLPDMRRMKVLTLPEDAPAEIDDWGRPLGTIQIPGESPSFRRFLWMFFLFGGLLMCVPGVYYAVHPPLPPGHQDAYLLSFLLVFHGVISVIIGLSLLFLVRPSHPPANLWIFEEGLFFLRYGQKWAVQWQEIQDFEATMSTGRPMFWVTLARDCSVAVSVGLSPEVMPLMEYVEIRLSAAQFLHRLEGIWQGHRQRFGIVALNRDGFEASPFFARWSDIRRVVSDAQHLFVDWSGATDWHSLRYRDVSFPYLVMAISHVLIDEHARFPKVDA